MPWNARLLVAGVLVFAAVAGAQSKDDLPPVIHPHPRPVPAKPKPTPLPSPSLALVTAPLIVTCDLACTWSLDGDAKGSIDAGGSAKLKIGIGQHFVSAKATDGSASQQKDIVATVDQQVVVHIELEMRHRDPQQRGESPGVEQAFQEGLVFYLQQRYHDAFPLFQQGCFGGHPKSCAYLGMFYQAPYVISLDYGRAAQLFEQACDGGVMMGCNHLGVLYQWGNGVSRSVTRARELYQRACIGGDHEGCSNADALR